MYEIIITHYNNYVHYFIKLDWIKLVSAKGTTPIFQPSCLFGKTDRKGILLTLSNYSSSELEFIHSLINSQDEKNIILANEIVNNKETKNGTNII